MTAHASHECSAYGYFSVSRGDYGFCASSAEFDAALRRESEKAKTGNERWHAMQQVSYALACRTVQYAPWMAPFVGERA